MQTLAVIDEVCANALHAANIDVLRTKPVVSFYARTRVVVKLVAVLL